MTKNNISFHVDKSTFINKVNVKIFNSTPWELPKYATPSSSGFDVRAFIEDKIILKPGDSFLVPTGIYLELPSNREAQVRPRSGLAAKYGISIVNSPGTVDADYRGQIHVNLINLGKTDFCICPGDRIAQVVIVPFEQANWIPVNSKEDLLKTERGDNGHGSSGVK